VVLGWTAKWECAESRNSNAAEKVEREEGEREEGRFGKRSELGGHKRDEKDMMHQNSITSRCFTTVLLETCSSSKNVLSKVECREMNFSSKKVGLELVTSNYS